MSLTRNFFMLYSYYHMPTEKVNFCNYSEQAYTTPKEDVAYLIHLKPQKKFSN